MSATLSTPSGFSAGDLVFNDNFSGTTLKAAYWNTYITSVNTGNPWNSNGQGGSGVGGNGVDADYFMPSQVSVNNGLTLTAVQQSVAGDNYINGQVVPETFPVTSGVISSYGKFQFDGGYLQISMKEPGGDGSWPGLWLLPGKGATQNFELDIQEGGYTGFGNPNNVMAYHLHTNAGVFGGAVNTGVDLTAGFNTYAINWVPGKSITWYFNGQAVGEITSAQAAIPNQPMEVILDNQVATPLASAWHTVLDSSTPHSMPMQIGDVQLYQQPGAGDSVTGANGAVGPVVTSVSSSPAAGDLDAGNTVLITLNMSEAITVSGQPTLALNDRGTASYSAAKSDPGKGVLVFDYVVGANQNTPNLAVLGVNLPQNATVKDQAGQSADFTAANATLGLQIDTLQPSVAGIVTSPSGGTLHVGNTVLIRLNMSEAVTVSGQPTLALNDGGTASYSAAKSDPGKGVLVFDYVVGANQNTPNLAVLRVNLPQNATVKDEAGQSADFTAANATLGLQIGANAAVGPVVTSVSSSPAAGDLDAGNTVLITLNMSEAVTVSGQPTLALNDRGTASYSAAKSDPGKGVLVFDYVVGANQNTPNLAVLGVNLPQNAAVKDQAGQSADFTAANATLGLQIDTLQPSVAGIVTSPSSGTLHVGNTVLITLNMSEAVTVSGQPTLALNDGGTASYSAAKSDPDKGVLVFDYVVGANQNTPNLAVLRVNLPQNATVKDQAGQSADFTAANATLGLQIGANAAVGPVVTSVSSSPAAGDLDAGNTVLITLNMSEAVTVSGQPTLALNDRGTASYSAAKSDPGKGVLVFDYVVGANQNTPNLAVLGVNLPQNATVKDQAGRSADFTAANATLGLQIDTLQPSLASIVTSPSSGTLRAGMTVTITLEMSEPVTVSFSGSATARNTPELILSDGAIATYDPALSNRKALVFQHVVRPGETLRELSVRGIELPVGAAIRDLAGNSANLGALTLQAGRPQSRISISSGPPTVSTATGMIDVSGTAGLELVGASSAYIHFDSGAAATLKLDSSALFSGLVAGFGGQDGIDLADIAFGPQTRLTFTPNQTHSRGVLSVTDGAHTAHIALLGNYMAAAFAKSGDGHGGTFITDPPTSVHQALLTQPHA